MKQFSSVPYGEQVHKHTRKDKTFSDASAWIALSFFLREYKIHEVVQHQSLCFC